MRFCEIVRGKRGLRSQLEVSQMAEISRQQIVNIEKGADCRLSTVIALCRALGIETINIKELQP